MSDLTPKYAENTPTNKKGVAARCSIHDTHHKLSGGAEGLSMNWVICLAIFHGGVPSGA